MQENLKNASEQYGDLETKHKEEMLKNEEIINKKNECIAVLRKELASANEILDGMRQDNLQKEVEGLSPTAAAASRLIKSGMTMTEIYTQYVNVMDELASEKQESARLKSYVTHIISEIEDKGPLLKKQREDYENALETVSELTKRNDELVMEIQNLRELCSECKRLEGVSTREKARLKKEMSDLGRQVCHLLKEVEQSRTGSSSTSTDQDLSDSVSSADIITKRLVTFSDIAELQSNNQRLLALVRELTAKQEEAESYDPAAIAKLKMEIETLREQQADNLEQLEKQNKMTAIVVSQRDMYKTLYHQAMKASGESVPMELGRSSYLHDSSSPKDESDEQIDEKVKDLENKLEKCEKEVEYLKEENELYRKEKNANEKILLEQLDSLKAEVKELTRANIKFTVQVEENEEKFKIFKNNIEIYKNQIAALEKNNKIYNETIIKHEQTITYLKDEALQAQTKLSRAEVMLANLQKENALLHDAEARLLKERELNKRESHTQNMIQTNIELIKATLERNDAESRIRLEARLDEAHRECAALRRRLQEEQDNFRQLGEHLEKQTELAQKRMEEEKQQAEKLRGEVAELRDDLVSKSNQIEELTKKLKCSIPTGLEGSSDARKYRQMEQMLADSQAEVQTLQLKLKTAKQTIEQHCNIAEAAEKQLKDVMQLRDADENKIKELEKTIAELQEQCSELKGELSVQTDGQDVTNTDLNTKLRRLEQDLNNTKRDLKETREELENARNEISTLTANIEEAENKYTREMMLHSTDLQALASLKEELTKAVNEMNEVRHERDQAREAMEESRISWQNQEKLFQNEKEEITNRFKDMELQNALLLDQIQALNTQLSIIQAQATADQSAGDSSFNRSLTEDDVKNSDQLFKIIKYLRQEKDISVSKCEILEAEQQRLKSQHELLVKQFEEAKAALEVERQKSEVSVVTAAKHAEILRKVETLNAITDSNRALRQERDLLITQITEFKTRVNTLEEQIAPLQEKNMELTVKAEAMQTENISIRGEATRWRQRANFLIEKSNRTSPEDWKKLQNERETLAKQLTIERANNTKLTDENNNLKQDKTKLEEQLRSLRAQNNSQSEEIARLREEINSLQSQVSTLSQTLEQIQEKHKNLVEENRLLTEDTASKDVTITDLKNNLIQIRKIAKKYKTQCEDQTKELEALKQQEVAENITPERQEQLRQEGRSELEQRLSQLEQNHKERLEELNQQVASVTEANDGFKKEIETLKQHNIDKEERFKTLFKNAKDRIMSLTEINYNLKEELSSRDRSRLENEGEATDGGGLQAEVERLQKEKSEILAEKQQEKDRLMTEIETLTQRVNQLQRQLGMQQGSKPSTSSASSEKSTSEPPTANIKPMAGLLAPKIEFNRRSCQLFHRSLDEYSGAIGNNTTLAQRWGTAFSQY